MIDGEFVTVAQLRGQLADVLGRLEQTAPVYVTQRGQARAVLLDVDRYRELMAQLEYLDDSIEALLGRQRRARGEAMRPLDAVIRDLTRRERRQEKPARRRTRARVSR